MSVFALVATVSGAVPPTSRGILAVAASATGTAPQPGRAIAVNALVATAAGLVNDAQVFSVLPHVTARSTSSVSDNDKAAATVSGKQSTSSAAAKVQSTSGTGDTREAAASVTRKNNSTSSVS